MAGFHFYPGEPMATLMRIVGPEVHRAARTVQFTARGQAGHETGRLSASITVSPVIPEGSKIKATIGSDVPYAIYNHEGVGLWGSGHPITPRRAKNLVFYIDGRKIVTKSVRGYPGTHFLIKGLHATRWRVVETP